MNQDSKFRIFWLHEYYIVKEDRDGNRIIIKSFFSEKDYPSQQSIDAKIYIVNNEYFYRKSYNAIEVDGKKWLLQMTSPVETLEDKKNENKSFIDNIEQKLSKDELNKIKQLIKEGIL